MTLLQIDQPQLLQVPVIASPFRWTKGALTALAQMTNQTALNVPVHRTHRFPWVAKEKVVGPSTSASTSASTRASRPSWRVGSSSTMRARELNTLSSSPLLLAVMATPRTGRGRSIGVKSASMRLERPLRRPFETVLTHHDRTLLAGLQIEAVLLDVFANALALDLAALLVVALQDLGRGLGLGDGQQGGGVVALVEKFIGLPGEYVGLVFPVKVAASAHENEDDHDGHAKQGQQPAGAFQPFTRIRYCAR